MKAHRSLLAATAAVALMGGAQATVTSSTNGLTTTYTEDFNNNSTSFSGALRNVAGADDFLWLRGSATTSSYTFTSLPAATSFRLTFNYLASPGTRTTDPAGPGGTFSFTGPGNTTVASGALHGLTGVGGTNAAAALALAGLRLAFEQNIVNPNTGLSRVIDIDILPTVGTAFAAGNYTLTFNYGALSGVKVDDVTLAVTAVPEPGTYALMLAGLGVVGLVAGRRRRSHAGA